jgi:LmbE family N-acetylglucosaminyl deacetylase
VHRAVHRAVRERTPDVLFYSAAASVPSVEDRILNENDPAHLALKIHPWVEAKYAAMMCHRTQHLLFKRRRQLTDLRDAIRFVESFRRHWPTLPDNRVPDDPFAALLLEAGAWWPEQPA